MTVLEVIQKSADFLARKGVESPRLNAELLLAHVLKLPRMKLYLNFERQLSEKETNTLRELIRRRSMREPVQHIVGSTSFCGFEIQVNRHVLVPRPETEQLAEAGWGYLKEVSTRRRETVMALDFGTGSGCIAVALARHCPGCRVLATDASPEALEVARANAVANGVGDQIQFLHGSDLGVVPRDRGFDLLIGNPPYVPSGEIESLPPEVKDYDPRLALDGGADGLECHRMLAIQAGNWLASNGKMMLEFGDGQATALARLLEEQNWIVESLRADYSQRQRFLIARRT